MIQAYIDSNTNFSQNGDMVLLPTSCALTAKLNGSWQVKLTHPIDAQGRWRFITDEAVIKMPSFNGTQLFRVYERTKTDREVTALLQPIFFDAGKEVFIVDKRPTDMTGQEALNVLTEGTDYSGVSNITARATAYYQKRNLLECISGKDENAFINRWGGEAIYDNYTIYLNDHAGSDNGVALRYGLNTNGVEEKVDMTKVVTRVYPEAYNGRAYSGGYIDSDNINAYPIIRTGVKEYSNIKLAEDATTSDYEKTDVTICQTQADLDAALLAAVQADFEAGLDKPTVTLKVKMFLLQNTEAYQEFASLASVSLGDIVHLFHTKLGITSTERVIELTFDAVREEVTAVTLGEPEFTYFDTVNTAMTGFQSQFVNVQNETNDIKYGLRSTAEMSEATRAYFWTDERGAHVTTYPNNDTEGDNVLIGLDGMAVRNGETELAKFGANLIELGKNSDSAVISFINDRAQMGLSNGILEILGNGAGSSIFALNVALGDFSPDADHTSPLLQLYQDILTYRTRALLRGEDVYIQGHALFDDDGSVFIETADTSGKIKIQDMPVYPYKSYNLSTGVNVYRQLNMCTLVITSRVSLSANTAYSLGTLPSGYRPPSSFAFVAQYNANGSGVPQGSARGVVNTDGSVTVTVSTARSNVDVYATVSWITDEAIS